MLSQVVELIEKKQKFGITTHIKPDGDGFFGPADRGMDRFAVEVDADGVLTIDTSQITLGPLPVELGTPGVIPPLVPHERACS